MARIVVDAFGGDNAPNEIIKGCIDAVNDAEGFEIVLVGKENIIKEQLSLLQYNHDRVSIVNADDIISNDESPVDAVRRKPNSSIVKAIDTLNEDTENQAFISAGSTGAVLTASVLMIKRVKGIQRPALAPILPTVTGKNVMLIDCGANIDVKPINLVQFGKIGSHYMKNIMNVASPRVALLSNGSEDSKGSSVGKESFPLMKEGGFNFVGNMEARELLSGEFDVIVSDGFSGNIALKACEGTALSLFDIIKQEIMNGGLRAKIGYLLLKPALKKVKKRMDYTEQGGATLLGLQKIVVKAHGSSKAKSIKGAINMAVNLIKNNYLDKINNIE